MVQAKDGRDRADGFAVGTHWLTATLVVVMLSAISVRAQSTPTPISNAPAALAPSTEVEGAPETVAAPVQPVDKRTPLLRRRSVPPADAGSTEKPTDKGPATWRIMAALLVVLGAIFVIRWFGRRVMGGPTGGTTRAVQVVSRTLLAPKQQLLLVQVGRRLVLVGNSGNAMASLCEISDGEEVSELLGQVQSEKNESITRAFGNLFRREQEKYDEPQQPAGDPLGTDAAAELERDESMGTSRDELNELLNKVRGLKSQFRR